MPADPKATEERFIQLLDRAFAGWQAKIEADFSEEAYQAELADLLGDDLYRSFGLAVPEYVLIRLMGRVSISIGRRIGELYDNLPKYVAAARFGLDPKDVAAKIDGLNLDVRIPYDKLSDEDKALVVECANKHLKIDTSDLAGLGIEIRYNFNPNDSSRLRKDSAMAEGLRNAALSPIYLVFSGISPRDEAMQRLQRAGWTFLIAAEASEFTKCVLGLDLAALLADPAVQERIQERVNAMMIDLVESAAFRNACASAAARKKG